MQNIKTKLFLLLTCFTIAISSIAQTQYAAPKKNSKKQSILSVHFLANDFITADYLHHHSITNTISHWTSLKDMSLGLGLNYLQNLTSHISLSGRIDGSFTRYNFQNRSLSTQNKILLEADAGFNLKMLPDKYVIVPYLHASIGSSLYDRYFGAYLPLGAGLQFTISKGAAFVFSNAQYRIHLTDNTANHFNFSIGVGGLLTKGKPDKSIRKSQVAVNPNSDIDSDGMPDYWDSCRTVPGVAKYKGCPVPDSDNDGISNNSDQCPSQAGVLKYHGCPIPDTDGDGINDESDSCITQPGIIRYNGCPIPDTDGDGVNDDMDECHNVPGTAANHGCPVAIPTMQSRIDTLAHQIFFASGSTVLLSKSLSPLGELVNLLKQDVHLELIIEGHTDNTGTDAGNITLSQRRADIVVRYFIQHGTAQSRLQAKGYGSAMPIANNNTVEGRSMNRRVEIKSRDL